MKRRDLVRRINAIAAAKGVEVEYSEGGSHTKVKFGDRQTTIPRHNEINEITARSIIRYLEGEAR